MDFESPDVEKEFPGLYASESSRRSDSDYGDSGQEKTGKKELLKNKRRDKKEKNKDKGYAALGEDSSLDEMDLSDSKNPLKPKKPKSFKFLHKKDKENDEKKEDKKRIDKKEEKKKEKDKGRDEKKKEKEKEKEERRREKEQKKKYKKDKKKKIENVADEVEDTPVFGVPLAVAVQRCPSHDGIKLPAVIRECIDYIEENGLSSEGIYRLSGVKSKVQQLRRAYNTGDPVKLTDQEPNVVASLLKQFLRELPEPVLTDDMMSHFEDVCLIPNHSERAEAVRQLIDRLPTPNRLLLQYMFKHMGHVIAREKETKMSYQNVCIVLSPTMQISHRILNVMFLNHKFLFSNVKIKKYIPPISSGGDLLDTVDKIEEEMSKQESLLALLHSQIASGHVSPKREERLWEAQRIVTLLKRKLKATQRNDSHDPKTEDSSLSLDKDSEDSQKETLSLDSKDITMPELEDSKSREKLNLTISDSETHSRNNKSGENVTVVSISPSEPSLTQVINDHKHNIPILPKPLQSTRSERVRQLQSLHDTPKFEPNPGSTSSSSESIKGENKSKLTHTIHQVEVLQEPTTYPSLLIDNTNNSDQAASHVTVIRVRQESKETRLDPQTNQELTRIPHVESSLSLDSNLPSEIRKSNTHLNIDKSHLRETRSLDESRTVDSEYESLLKEEKLIEAEHIELLSMNHDLTKKLQAERVEITRLKDEIQEMQTIYGYRTYSYDSSESESESEGESDTEDDLLQHLVAINQANGRLKSETSALTKRIQEEREAVVKLRVQLRQAQAKSQQPLVTTVY